MLLASFCLNIPDMFFSIKGELFVINQTAIFGMSVFKVC